jgi:peptidoglycan/LPS O-acetylase OafA/YrhL
MMHEPFHYGAPAIFDLANGDVGSFLSKIVTPWWKFLERLVMCAFYAGALVAIWRERRRAAPWAMAGIVVYLALVNAEVSTARHRFPADPFIYILTAASIALPRREKSASIARS